MIADAPAVLLVEDNPDDEELTLRGLRRTNLTHPVDVARDGQEALDYLFGNPDQAAKPLPFVVLLDLSLDIPPFHPHQLRHTLGTLLQETVGDARLTPDTLGHVGLASVAGYTKITEGRRRVAQDEMERRGL